MGKDFKLYKAFKKATDPSLRTDNWGYIMDVVDLVRSGEGFNDNKNEGYDEDDYGDDYSFYNDSIGGMNNSNNIISLIDKNLTQENANVILRTLTVIIALSENCGSRIRVAFSSNHFTNAILYEKLIHNKNVHLTIKKETAKTIEKLKDDFINDPSLKNMADLYKKVKKLHPYLLETTKSTSTSKPNVPNKNESKQQSQKLQKDYDEDDMLQQALKLSLEEYEHQSKKQTAEKSLPVQEQTQVQAAQVPQQQQQQQQPTVTKVRAMYDLQGSASDELSFKKDDVIRVIEPVYKDWWRGSLNGKIGIFPVNYVTAIPEKSEQEKLLERQEADNLLNKMDKIDSLQNILTANKHQAPDVILQDSQVNQLYSEVTPLRPGLTKMIGQYATKREELLRLHKVLSDSEHAYNSILNQATNVYVNPPQQQSRPPTFQTSSAHQPTVTNSPYPIAPQPTQNKVLPHQQIQQQQNQMTPPFYQGNTANMYHQYPN